MAQRIKGNTQAPPPSGSGNIAWIAVLAAAGILCQGIAFFGREIAFSVIGGIALFAALVLFLCTKAAPAQFPEQEGKRFGNAGERQAGAVLEHFLPHNFTVISNVTVTYDGKTNEIDNVIVGNSGVFVVEVKSWKGTVAGDCSAYYWMKQKTDPYGLEHERQLENPVKKLGTQIYRLAGHLKENGVRVFVRGAVYFPCSETELRVTGQVPDKPIFTAKTTPQLMAYLKSGTAQLSNDTVQRIIRLLSR